MGKQVHRIPAYESRKITHPVFNHINNFLCEHAEVGKYATMFFGVLSRNGDLQYINAGHPSPLLLRDGQLTEPFTEGSTPVGLVPGAHYNASSVILEANDTLILFSDGVTEAADPEDELFGVPRLREALAGRREFWPITKSSTSAAESASAISTQRTSRTDGTLASCMRKARARCSAATFSPSSATGPP